MERILRNIYAAIMIIFVIMIMVVVIYQSLVILVWIHAGAVTQPKSALHSGITE